MHHSCIHFALYFKHKKKEVEQSLCKWVLIELKCFGHELVWNLFPDYILILDVSVVSKGSLLHLICVTIQALEKGSWRDFA